MSFPVFPPPDLSRRGVATGGTSRTPGSNRPLIAGREAQGDEAALLERLALSSPTWARLLALERRLDAVLDARATHLRECLPAATRYPSMMSNELKILCSVNALHAGHATRYATDDFAMLRSHEAPHWTFRLEGTFTKPMTDAPRMSAVLKRVVIEVEPHEFGDRDGDCIFEWDSHTQHDAIDVIEFTRRSGPVPLNSDIKVHVYVSLMPAVAKVRITQKLATFCRIPTSECAITLLYLQFWTMCKSRGLCDPLTRRIKLSEELVSVLTPARGSVPLSPGAFISYEDVPSLLRPLLLPGPPLHYTLSVRPGTLGVAAFDIPCEVPLPQPSDPQQLGAKEREQKIKDITQEIHHGLKQLEALDLIHSRLLMFSRDPGGTVESWARVEAEEAAMLEKGRDIYREKESSFLASGPIEPIVKAMVEESRRAARAAELEAEAMEADGEGEEEDLMEDIQPSPSPSVHMQDRMKGDTEGDMQGNGAGHADLEPDGDVDDGDEGEGDGPGDGLRDEDDEKEGDQALPDDDVDDGEDSDYMDMRT